MMGTVLASLSAFSRPQAVLVALVACTLLLFVRSARETLGLDLTPRALLALDGSLFLLLLLFAVLIVLRFTSLA